MQALTRAKAMAQANVEEHVKKTLEADRAVHMEKLTESVAREKMKAEDGKLMVQLYVSGGTHTGLLHVTGSLSLTTHYLLTVFLSCSGVSVDGAEGRAGAT